MKDGCRRCHLATVFITCLVLFHQFSYTQYQNVRINNPFSTSPEEVTIAINPANPLNLAAGANLNFAYYSMDGGLSWVQQSMTSSSFGVWGDPCVTFDADGRLFYGHLSNPPSGGYWIDRIVIQQSANGGASWDDGLGIGYNPPRRMQDKEWLAVDLTSSPFHNNLYVAWTEFDSYGSTLPTDSSRILFSRSTDHGGSWSPPVRVSDVSGNCLDEDTTVEGAVPAIGPNGEVYLSWAGPLGIMFDKSTDGGVTWGTDVFVSSQPGGWDYSVLGIYRANGLPITACDISSSPYRGNIYANWTDQRNGPGNTDVFLAKSTDAGATWSAAVRVNDDTTNHEQFFSWMTIDQTSGYVYVVFYDRRNSTKLWTDVYVAKSTDGGETFSNEKVSQSPFNPRASTFFGDYTNIAAHNGMAYPIWMRLDTTRLSVWTAIMKEPLFRSRPVATGWNMVSVPLTVRDFRKSSLFSSSVGGPYAYDATYVLRDTLRIGAGYWIKLPDGGTITLSGDSVGSTTIPLQTHWNMIGSITRPVPVESITSVPPGLVVSQFFGYDGVGYVPVDTIQPGYAYWVRAQQEGTIELGSAGALASAERIMIVPGSELPPTPPGKSADEFFPRTFALEQNYPNPFNPTTTIQYTLPTATHVELRLLNPLGEHVRTLVDGMQGAGYRSVKVDASELASGVYFYELTAGFDHAIRKMVLIK